MFNSFSLPVLVPIFMVGALVVWIAGIQLANTTATLSSRFRFGEALGGIIFLAISTNLPEMAITSSAAVTHHLGLAIGNILGGIAVQTLVLVGLDWFGLKSQAPLTYRGASLALVLECAIVIAVLIIAIMGSLLPKSLIFARLTPSSCLITGIWLTGVWLLKKARSDLPWQDKGRAPDRDVPPDNGSTEDGKKQGSQKQETQKKEPPTTRTILLFVLASLATLLAGVVLEESGNAIAEQIGLSGVLFGATILALVTSLPEVSTGYQAIKIGAYELTMSDIFGGNAFLPVLFLLADLLSDQATLTLAKNTDIYLASLGILLTTVYICGLIFRPRRQILGMGIDSFVVLVFYVLGTAGLFAIALSSGKP